MRLYLNEGEEPHVCQQREEARQSESDSHSGTRRRICQEVVILAAEGARKNPEVLKILPTVEIYRRAQAQRLDMRWLPCLEEWSI